MFEKTPLEEKKRLEARIQETGSYKGFKLRQYYEYVQRLPLLRSHMARTCFSIHGTLVLMAHQDGERRDGPDRAIQLVKGYGDSRFP